MNPTPRSDGEEPVTCDYCGDPISESDQDLMIDHMHEGCWEEANEDA
jgi:hypothetical protein